MFKKENKIVAWLEEHKIINYTVLDDLSVNVNGSVTLERVLGDLKELPVQFNKVNGDFSIFDNKLTSLKGSPKLVLGDYGINNNQITSLKYCPNSISGSFFCGFNLITSLKYAPEIVAGNMYIHNNPITELDTLKTDFIGKLHFYNEKDPLNYLKGFEEFYDKEMLTLRHEDLHRILMKINLDDKFSNGTSSTKKIKI